MKNLFGIIVILLFWQTAFSQDKMLMEYSFRVEGLCGMCKDRIEETAMETGAESAVWDEKTKILSVEIDENSISVSKVRWALSQAGHDNGDFIAPDEVYEDLFLCCKYREESNKSDESDAETSSTVDGYIYGLNKDNKKYALIGANVVLLGSENSGTTTDFDGYFSLDNEHIYKEIVVSYIGFNTDTIELRGDDVMDITLSDGHQLQEVVIKYKKRTSELSFIKTLNIESISRDELTKAACCNLSESFETNPSIDVSFSDAVTGTKQIQMLGLAGPYVQITREFMPDVRAMSSIYGLTFTPGPWVESIQLIKGAGSVVNGFESLTGQINVELKKPECGEILHVNGYINEGARMELNVNTRKVISDHISTGLLLHGKRMSHGSDRNDDGFLDMPLAKDFIVINRWKWNADNGMVGQFGVKGTFLDHQGGSHEHFEGTSDNHEEHWRMYMTTKRGEAWLKTGVIFPENPNRSIGFQMSGVYHDQDSEFGFNKYNSTQKSFYSNLIYQEILKDSRHTLKAGMSYQYDNIEEFVAKSGAYNRNESVPGAFFEYTYNNEEKFAVIPGIRVDRHSNYGTFITPRLHMKYNLAPESIFRLTVGRGLRTASIFSENIGLFSTNRQIVLENSTSDNPYGLDAEVAWNYGVNWTQSLDIFDKNLVMSFDVYRTSFENQIVVDYENVREVAFYNLEGKSYSNSYQIKFDYELATGLDVRLAYRLYDVKTNYKGELKKRPMVPTHRAFINIAYKTESDWSFDITTNWKGEQRIPDTSQNPVEYQRTSQSEDYVLVNTQVSKKWKDKFEVYIGSENLLNYKQESAIIASDDPFGQYFDGSLVYAPLFGRNVYLGFRYNLVK